MTARRRIVVLATHFAEYSYRLAIALSAHADVLLVVSLQQLAAEAPQALADLESHRVAVVPYRREPRGARLMSSMRTVFAMYRHRPDLIIAHEQRGPLPSLVSIVGARMAPLHLIVHDPVPHLGIDADIPQRHHWFSDWARATATGFIVHGRYCREELLASLPGDRRSVHALEHGVLLPPAVAQRRQAERARALFFGRIEAYKGIDTLFGAADIAATTVPDFHLQIVGSGTEVARVRELASARPFVELVEGYMPPERVIESMQRASLILLPYDEASQSGVLSIAFANGRPVVATAVGSIEDTVAVGGGVVVPPRDSESFAEAMRQCLVDDALWQRLSVEASEAADRRMNWEIIVDDLLRSIDASDEEQ